MTPATPGMDPELFDQFIDQLDRYVRERLIPAEIGRASCRERV